MKSNFISIKWNRFLTEGETEQFPWLKEIKSIDPEELRDWMANSDVTLPAAWKTYRQELRDLPAASTPDFDEDGKLIGVTWPTKPE